MDAFGKLLSILAVSALALLPARADLIVNELHGFNVSGAAALPSISFIACSASTADATTYTFTDVAAGTEGATRRYLVGVILEDGTLNYGVASMTVEAVAATEIVDNDGARSISGALYISEVVASGTVIDIVVTNTEAVTSTTICWWAVYDLTSPTPTSSVDVNAINDGVLALTLSSTTINGVAVGVCGASAQPFTTTWAVLTERIDTTHAESSYSAADAAATGASMSVTCDYASGGDRVVGVAAAFR